MDGGQLTLYSGPTNASTTNYGALVSVTGLVTVAANSWIYPCSDTTNGGAPLFVMRNLTLSGGTSGGFDASGRGFAGGYGPGKGTVSGIYGGGGGYGGMGGTASNGPTGGPTYGLPNAPFQPGSGAGHANGGAGGGYIRIDVQEQAVLNGVLRANGTNGTVNGNGGGSGGGIFLMAPKVEGDATGILEARGGEGNTLGGGGGGGRIAVWYGVPEYRKASVFDGTTDLCAADSYAGYLGATSVTNGTGYVNPPTVGAAQPGSLVFLTVWEGTLLEVR